MNKRIKELMKQSGLQPYYDSQQGDIEKFAELIVKECAEVAKQADINGCNIGNYAWEKIKEHFGVEE